jgi:Na+/H+ antiporter NhaD/arsenite permease-like protein
MLVTVVFIAWTGMLPKVKIFSIAEISVYSKWIIRNVGLLVILVLSLAYSPTTNKQKIRKLNEFSLKPLSEVARYFVAIFITMGPVSVMLRDGHAFFLPIKAILNHTEHAAFLYFWFVSPFSAFLDNAPTYLVFFRMAGGDVSFLMNEGAKILAALSTSSVFMGALTYIGNAPNFMIKSITSRAGVAMPSFLGYMFWACLILLPLFLLISYLFLY